MKKVLVIIALLAGLQSAVFAQCDPAFSNMSYTGTSVQQPGNVPTIEKDGFGTLNFKFGVGSDAGCTAAAGNTVGSITITLSFTSQYSPESAADITGPGADQFDWIWDVPGQTLVGVSKGSFPVGASLDFAVKVKGLLETPGLQAPLTTLNYFSETNPPIVDDNVNNNVGNLGLNVDAALPVTLLSFEAAREGHLTNLTWSTTEETNSDRFEVQRSGSGEQWVVLGTVAASGESFGTRQYRFTDRSPVEGENLYRLRMVDKDETFAYSRIRNVAFNGMLEDLSVYPNPAVDQLTVRNFQRVTHLEILDLSGRTVYQSGQPKEGQVSVGSLPLGHYLIRITRADGSRSTQKVMIGK